MTGQSLWSGWGSEVMLCGRESLLMKSTRVPSAICTFRGLTPAEVIVMVLVATGGPDGVVGLLPQAASTRTMSSRPRFNIGVEYSSRVTPTAIRWRPLEAPRWHGSHLLLNTSTGGRGSACR